MPKYIYEEESFEEWAGEDDSFDLQETISKYKREPDGSLSEYEAAARTLDEDKLRATARLALAQLRGLGVVQLTVRYDGGSDEGFAHFQEARIGLGTIEYGVLVPHLQSGPLGNQPETPFYYRVPSQVGSVSRKEWTEEGLQLLMYELAAQLLGEGFGNGDLSIEGAFVADLKANTLTDIVPDEG